MAQRGLTSSKANSKNASHTKGRPQNFKPRQHNRKNKPLHTPPGFTLPQFRLLATLSWLIDDLSTYKHCLPDHLIDKAANLQAYAAQQQGRPPDPSNAWDQTITLGHFAGSIGQAIKSVFVAQAKTNKRLERRATTLLSGIQEQVSVSCQANVTS